MDKSTPVNPDLQPSSSYTCESLLSGVKLAPAAAPIAAASSSFALSCSTTSGSGSAASADHGSRGILLAPAADLNVSVLPESTLTTVCKPIPFSSVAASTCVAASQCLDTELSLTRHTISDTPCVLLNTGPRISPHEPLRPTFPAPQLGNRSMPIDDGGLPGSSLGSNAIFGNARMFTSDTPLSQSTTSATHPDSGFVESFGGGLLDDGSSSVSSNAVAATGRPNVSVDKPSTPSSTGLADSPAPLGKTASGGHENELLTAMSEAPPSPEVQQASTSTGTTALSMKSHMELLDQYATYAADLQLQHEHHLESIAEGLRLSAGIAESVFDVGVDAVLRQCTTALRQFHQLQSTTLHLENCLSESGHVVSELRQQVVSMSSQLNSSRQQCSSLLEEKESLGARLAEAEAASANKRSLLDERRNLESQQQTASLQASLQTQQELNLALEAECQKASEKAARLTEQLHLRQVDLDRSRASQLELQKMKQGLSQALEQSQLDQRVLGRLLPQYESLCSELESAKEEVLCAKEKESMASKDLERGQIALEAATAENEKLKSRITSLEAQVHSFLLWRNKKQNEASHLAFGPALSASPEVPTTVPEAKSYLPTGAYVAAGADSLSSFAQNVSNRVALGQPQVAVAAVSSSLPTVSSGPYHDFIAQSQQQLPNAQQVVQNPDPYKDSVADHLTWQAASGSIDDSFTRHFQQTLVTAQSGISNPSTQAEVLEHLQSASGSHLPVPAPSLPETASSGSLGQRAATYPRRQWQKPRIARPSNGEFPSSIDGKGPALGASLHIGENSGVVKENGVSPFVAKSSLARGPVPAGLESTQKVARRLDFTFPPKPALQPHLTKASGTDHPAHVGSVDSSDVAIDDTGSDEAHVKTKDDFSSPALALTNQRGISSPRQQDQIRQKRRSAPGSLHQQQELPRSLYSTSAGQRLTSEENPLVSMIPTHNSLPARPALPSSPGLQTGLQSQAPAVHHVAKGEPASLSGIVESNAGQQQYDPDALHTSDSRSSLGEALQRSLATAANLSSVGSASGGSAGGSLLSSGARTVAAGQVIMPVASGHHSTTHPVSGVSTTWLQSSGPVASLTHSSTVDPLTRQTLDAVQAGAVSNGGTSLTHFARRDDRTSARRAHQRSQSAQPLNQQFGPGVSTATFLQQNDPEKSKQQQQQLERLKLAQEHFDTLLQEKTMLQAALCKGRPRTKASILERMEQESRLEAVDTQLHSVRLVLKNHPHPRFG